MNVECAQAQRFATKRKFGLGDSVPGNGLKWRLYLTYGQKVFLLATLPLVLSAGAIATLVNIQSHALSDQETSIMEARLLEAKQSELQNYMSLARTSIAHIYGTAAPDDEDAKKRVTQILSALTYGKDGYFFVYDYDGNNLVSPKQTSLIGKNWINAQDGNGALVVRQLIDTARQGGGTLRYVWPKPSSGKTTDIYSYVIGLQDWRWVIGTGIWVDDVYRDIASMRRVTGERIQSTFRQIIVITMVALLLVFVSVMLLNIRERYLADAKLKKLTQRVIDTQEEERQRVARELHDGISQVLVGVRYALDLAARRLKTGKSGVSDGIENSIDGLNHAIQEVRRISRDLRPGVLDDLGLGPALTNLTDDFAARTKISVEFQPSMFRNRLHADAKTALFRIAQEALTNIERHANASSVKLSLNGHRAGVSMKIRDDGIGFNAPEQRAKPGLGLRNMQERIEQLDGTLRVFSGNHGTLIEASLPARHFIASTQTNHHPKQETA